MEIWTAAVDGSDLQRVTCSEWLPAGSNTPGSPILVYDLAFQREERIAGPALHPIWLHDTRRVLFHTGDRLWLVDPRHEEDGAARGPGEHLQAPGTL